LSPWTVTTSSSKCTESSLAFARGPHWWRAAAVHVDLQSTARRQKQQWVDAWLDLLQRLLLQGMKNPKGFSVYL
jgi:hypothetical protein